MGSSSDNVIRPWDSCWFNYYPVGSDASVVEMEDRPIYINDWIGLKTLNENN